MLLIHPFTHTQQIASLHHRGKLGRGMKWTALENLSTMVSMTVLPSGGRPVTKSTPMWLQGHPGMGRGWKRLTGAWMDVLLWTLVGQASTKSWTSLVILGLQRCCSRRPRCAESPDDRWGGKSVPTCSAWEKNREKNKQQGGVLRGSSSETRALLLSFSSLAFGTHLAGRRYDGLPSSGGGFWFELPGQGIGVPWAWFVREGEAKPAKEQRPSSLAGGEELGCVDVL